MILLPTANDVARRKCFHRHVTFSAVLFAEVGACGTMLFLGVGRSQVPGAFLGDGMSKGLGMSWEGVGVFPGRVGYVHRRDG